MNAHTGKRRFIPPMRNDIVVSSIVRHRLPLFGDAPDIGPDTRLRSVLFVQGTCNGAEFDAVVLAPGNFSPQVDMYGAKFEHHEKLSVGIIAMSTRPENVTEVEHPEIETPEQAEAFAEAMRAQGREAYSGDRILLDVPFKDKDRAKAYGARWSPEERRWYVMSRLVDIDDFAEWMPKECLNMFP